MLKTVIFWLECISSYSKMSWTKLEKLSIPNLDVGEKNGKVVIK